MKVIYISKQFDRHEDLCDYLTDNNIPHENIVSILWNGKFILITSTNVK